MRLTRLATVVLTTIGITHAASAELIPDSILGSYKQPQRVCETKNGGKDPADRYTCYGTVFDTIVIQRKSQELAYVGITLQFTNGHNCGFYGIGRWRNQALIASAKEPYGDRICRVRLTFSDRDVTTNVITAEDEGWPCTDFCGTNGNLEGVTLPRAR